jgi:hypothetical protein
MLRGLDGVTAMTQAAPVLGIVTVQPCVCELTLATWVVVGDSREGEASGDDADVVACEYGNTEGAVSSGVVAPL